MVDVRWSVGSNNFAEGTAFIPDRLETLLGLWPRAFRVGSVAAGALHRVPQMDVCEVNGSEGSCHDCLPLTPHECNHLLLLPS